MRQILKKTERLKIERFLTENTENPEIAENTKVITS